MAETPLKTREEYLIEFEKKLVDSLKNLYKAINQDFALVYGLSVLLLLLRIETVSEVSFLGAKITFNNEDVFILIPIAIAIIYILAAYHLLQIASVIKRINQNGLEILSINQIAAPITVQNVNIFSEGVCGLVLFLSRLVLSKMLKRKKQERDTTNTKKRLLFTRVVSLCLRILLPILTLFITAIVLYLPIVVLAYYQYNKFIKLNFNVLQLDTILRLSTFSFGLIILVIIYLTHRVFFSKVRVWKKSFTNQRRFKTRSSFSPTKIPAYST